MFSKPIKHVRLKSFEEVKQFSVFSGEYYKTPKTMNISYRKIAFTTEDNRVYLTLYRKEICDILEKEGYQQDVKAPVLSITCAESQDRYQWLEKIAMEENWAYTYELAYEKAQEKGIKEVSPTDDLQVKQIEYYEDKKNKKVFFQMISIFLQDDSEKNIGTYIVIDDKTVVLCDEYGRTYHVRAKKSINNMVNKMIEAGYTRNPNPHEYVGELKKDENNET